MHPWIRKIGTILFVAGGVCGCNAANQEEWNQLWNKPLFGSHAGGRGTEIWTIECNAYKGPNRQKMAAEMVALLKKVPQLDADQVWSTDEPHRSRVFYGLYTLHYAKTKRDRKTGTRSDYIIQLNDQIKGDLKFIRELSLGSQHPFFSARPIRKALPDVGPPEWDLRNAKGIYTLNVGVTYPTPTLQEYKEAAVQWVRYLRKRGYDAYYYHDPDKAQSSICVGTFNENAFTLDAQGRRGYSQAVKALQRKEQFKYNLENGRIVARRARNPDTNRIEKIPNWSFLVKIPRRDDDTGAKGS